MECPPLVAQGSDGSFRERKTNWSEVDGCDTVLTQGRQKHMEIIRQPERVTDWLTHQEVVHFFRARPNKPVGGNPVPILRHKKLICQTWIFRQ